jgi:hypothetical protein
MAAHVTVASVHDFKLFSYFFALFKNVFFLNIDACAFKIYVGISICSVLLFLKLYLLFFKVTRSVGIEGFP